MNEQPVDWTRHLSREARTREPNPMKVMWKLVQNPNMISFANGDPHYELYPISQIDFKVPSIEPDSDPVVATTFQSFTSFKDEPCALDLRTALQYGAGPGLDIVRRTLKGFTDTIHNPPCPYTVTLSLGNADALTKAFRLLGDQGDAFLVEEFSFPAMVNAPLAHGVHWVPVEMDGEGLIPARMEKVLREWDTVTQGRRPHVLYTVPSGQNPTGCTMGVERKREIYEIAQRYDLIILEDDPYYFLDYNGEPPAEGTNPQEYAKLFVESLKPSFLSMDVDGRVMRFDSFSKVIVPGMRLGWICSNHEFADRLEMLIDSSTQHPAGISQAFVAEMLSERGWSTSGFLHWTAHLCKEYRRRRDFFMGILRKEMGDCGLVSADTPVAGMFVWIRVHFEHHPRYQEAVQRSEDGSPEDLVALMVDLSDNLFKTLLENRVAMMPAKTFAIASLGGVHGHVSQKGLGHYRATFVGTNEMMEKGLRIFASVVKEFFRVVD